MALADYHLFQIPCQVKDSDIGIKFSELENDLGGGFYSQMLYGSENGERFWKLTLPTLSDSSSRTVTGVNGEPLTHAKYLWSLYCEHKVSGMPFAYQCPFSKQYYLVRFANDYISLQRMMIALYSSGIELKQWRIKGQSAYHPAHLANLEAWYPPYPSVGFPAPMPGGWWNESLEMTEFQNLVVNGDVGQTGTLNGVPTMQFNITNDDGFLETLSTTPVAIREIFVLMKMREATFSNYAGILTGPDADFSPALIGNSGTTRFFDNSFTGQQYRLNGVLYDNDNMQAPMNEWGIVHLRYATGYVFKSLQVGKDRNFSGRFAEMDVAEILMFRQTQPMDVRREVMEYLQTIYNLVLT